MASEQVLSILATDNLDVACAAIEKAAMERAVSDVDEGFATSYEVRRRHREVSGRWLVLLWTHDTQTNLLKLRNGQTFWDPSAPQSNFAINLPDPLQIKANGLQPHQAGVYEDFGRHFGNITIADGNLMSHLTSGIDPRRRIASSRPGSTVSYNRNDMGTPAVYAPSPVQDHTPNQTAFEHQEAMERFSVSDFCSNLHLLSLTMLFRSWYEIWRLSWSSCLSNHLRLSHPTMIFAISFGRFFSSPLNPLTGTVLLYSCRKR